MPTSLALGKPLTGMVLAGMAGAGIAGHLVDIGPGLGAYARAFRPLTGTAKWTAVEAWAPYVDSYNLKEYYDEAIIADVRYLDFTKLGPVDIMLFGDVLEHMSAGDAMDVLESASHQARFLVISIPIGHWPQDEIDGNPFEAHVEDDLSAEKAQAMVPGLCSAQAYLNDDGVGIGLFFAAGKQEDRDVLRTHVNQAEARLNAKSCDDILHRVTIDFGDEAELAPYRDAITNLVAPD